MITNQQIQTLKQALLDRQKNIQHEFKVNDHFGLEFSHVNESIGELSHYDNHPADTGTALFEREKDIALNEHVENELHSIDQALTAIEVGSYGKCTVCDKDIPFERLEAIPWTLQCVDHTLEQLVSHSRPVEERVTLPPFGQFEYDEKDATFFDAEDAWQAVGRYGTSETPSDFFDPEKLDYNGMFIEDDELIGFVEEIEAFVGTDIHGNHVQVYPNAVHAKYEERLADDDDDGSDSPFGEQTT